MRRPLVTLGLALGLAAAAGAADAASGLTLEVSQSRPVQLKGDAANVIVGDPTIADVAMINAHSLILFGRGYGSTHVTVLDHAGRALLDTRVTVVDRSEGVVTLHRGAAATDYSCSPRCQAVSASKDPAPAAAGGGSGDASPAAAIHSPIPTP